MPESAEVKLTTDFLDKVMTNKIITKLEFISGQYLNSDPEGFDQFYEALPLMVEEISCKGKFIYMKCFNEFNRFYILHSMRLTGSWRNQQSSYSRWYVELENGKKVWFHDTRCLATLKFTTDEKELTDYLAKLGPDILTEEFSLPVWKKLVQQHRNKNITSFLMDQEIMAGIGNWLKAEILFCCKISPLRKVSSLSESECDRLFEAIRIIPRKAYMNKGLSTRDYTDPDGKKGFQEFHLHVYGKKHAKRTKTADGRITYWDDKVQS
jgi:DNA-formamidopyrimidine glycosylase